MLVPLERQRLYRQVAEEIKRYILEHGLKKGDALPTEAEFARQLGVSRPTVREALKGLQLIGVLTSRKGSGHAVGALDLIELARQFSFHIQAKGADFKELAETRLFLEINVLPLTAERATEQDFSRLQQAIDLLRKGIEQKDHAACIAADIAFHRALFEASQNRVLASFADVMKEFFADIRRALFTEDALKVDERTVWEHQTICDALRRKEVRQAQETMYAHLSVYRSDKGMTDGIRTFVGHTEETRSNVRIFKRSNVQTRKGDTNR